MVRRICFKPKCRALLPQNKRVRYCAKHKPRNGAFYKLKRRHAQATATV